MALKDPKGITEAGINVGVTKTGLSLDKMMVSGFLAGAYIAFGGLVAISVSSGLDPKVWALLPDHSATWWVRPCSSPRRGRSPSPRRRYYYLYGRGQDSAADHGTFQVKLGPTTAA